jgi:hypothetical protein
MPLPADGSPPKVLIRSPQSAVLLALFGGPLAWTLHLLASYLAVALWCSMRWGGLGVAIAVLTVLFAVAALASAVLALRLWRRGQAALLSDAEPGVRESWDARLGERGAHAAFVGLLALFLDVLFAYLIVLEGVPAVFAPSCHAWMVR